MSTNDDFLRQLLEAFRQEAREHVQGLVAGLLELERGTTEQDGARILSEVFRHVHSLKGAARAVDQRDIEATCQSMESVLAAWMKGDFEPGVHHFDTLQQAVDTVEGLLAGSPVASTHTGAAIHSLEHLLSAGDPIPAEEPASDLLVSPPGEPDEPPAERHSWPPGETTPPDAGDDTVRVSVAKLSSLFTQSEELVGDKLAAAQTMALAKRALSSLRAWRDGVHGGGQRLLAVDEELAAVARSAAVHHRSLEITADGLVSKARQVLMQPCSAVLPLFSRMVRDMGRELDKEIELILDGVDVEIDRRILEGIKDPLIHLVRNACHHGIESPTERENRGKPRSGRVMIAVSLTQSDRVEILVSDDGRGIDVQRVVDKAVAMGLVDQDDPPSAESDRALDLVFEPELTTSMVVTDISGRGVGMAIVREHVERVGGQISLASQWGEGTRCRLRLPVSLSTFHGVRVEVADRTFLLPVAAVDRVLRVQAEEVRVVGGRDTVKVDGKHLPLIGLGEVLGLTPAIERAEPAGLHLIVLEAGSRRWALQVDRVLDVQEGMTRSLGKQLLRVRNFAGAAVLGSGALIPVLAPADLARAVTARGGEPRSIAEGDQEEEKRSPLSILVAEDTITSRMLLKNVLESTGYRVRTAIDGAAAFAALRSETFDLVVSDVEMPRLNGFELTRKIRSDGDLSRLPIVLLTGLESRADRERGIDAGANAYLVKSGFDQSRLLSVIQQLVGRATA